VIIQTLSFRDISLTANKQKIGINICFRLLSSYSWWCNELGYR